MPPKPKPTTTPLSATKHADKRTNIPTEELKDFLPDEEQRPAPIRYPRDPSLDPQLVWKGKDEQDASDLEVPAVPIYIQEKVHPQALIEDLRAHSKDDADQTLSLFSDFNGIKFEDMVDFYHHEQNWSNRMVLGDSLLVMNSLAEKEGLKGKVQMIYIDPPYGIKFGSNWQVSTRKRDVKDGKAEDATRQPEQIKAFRDTWELGIHSYLAYLRDRLTVARELLTESGSVFVQIGEENMHLVRCLMDEVFGAENLVRVITFRTTVNLVGNYLGSNSDYLLWYSRDLPSLKYRQAYQTRAYADDIGGRYTRVELTDGTRRVMTESERRDISTLPAGAVIYRHGDITSQDATPSGTYPYTFRSLSFHPGSSRHWTTAKEGLNRLASAQRLAVPSPKSLAYVRYIDDFPVGELANVWTDTQTGAFTDDKVYVVQTNTKVIQRCILMATDPGDLVLDPTCGSGTTAYVAEQWGRRWITCDTSRVALALARTRLMAARHPYYLLADSPEGVKKEAEVTGIVPPDYATAGDIRKGFVYKRVPHVTLKSIANNAEIDAIHERYQPQLDTLLAKINKAAGKAWKEWEVPRKAPAGVKDSGLKTHHVEWWTLRGKRQAEIDASIARRADTEVLYDQPYEDGKRVRVSGPFTVESLSPHRQLSVSTKVALGDGASDALPGVSVKALGPDQFGTMSLDHLKKAGVQNTVKGQRLKFTRLEPFAGEWIHAAGEYLEHSPSIGGGGAETSKRVAVCIGPEYGTVGAELVHHAAVEAVQGVGFDLLLVCGFAFDPGAYEEVKRYGKLTVLMSRMNPDLAMGEDLLKKTGAANLFLVFGEPDINITRKDSKVQVEIRGLDVYDPTTGEVRSHTTDDIACWFVDTDYNGQSFFVRHAYFTGAGDPYEKLRKTLKAEVDEAAWSSLYATVSRPFDPPTTGKIAVKVINHYGDEVLKVYEVK